MNRLLSKLFGRKAGVAQRTARPRIEALEDRWCPAVTVNTINGGATLVISSNAAGDTVTVRDNADNDLLQVIRNGVTSNFQTSQITQIVFNMGGGNDQVFYQLAGGSDFEFAKAIQVDLGAGNDQAFIDLANDGQGGAADIEAPLVVSILGRAGNDQAEVRLGEIEDETVSVSAQMGTGNDVFRTRVQSNLDFDARLNIDALGQAGNDLMEVLATDDIFIDDDAQLNVAMSGGTGNDQLRMLYAGELDGELNLTLNGDQNNDDVRALLTLDNDSDGVLRARVFGGAANDFLRLSIQDNSGGDVDILTALLDGGAGTDSQVSTANVTVVNVP